MAFEDVCSVERLLGWSARAGTETTDHCAFVVGEGVTVLVILASEALDVIITCCYWAFLWSFRLVGEHVCFQVLEGLAAVWYRASSLVTLDGQDTISGRE